MKYKSDPCTEDFEKDNVRRHVNDKQKSMLCV